jgi:cobalt-zinc-cadmium efflux system outer membrane protein
MFRRRGFDLLVAKIAVEGAHADELAAGAVANPAVGGSVSKSFTYEATCHGCSDIGWSVSVTDQGALSTLLAGKRGLRVQVAHAAVGVAGSTRDDTQRLLEFAVKQQYVDTAAAEGATELSREAAQSAQQTVDLVNVRYHAGEVSEADVVRAEAAELEAQQTVDTAAQDLLTAKVALLFLLGVSAPTPTFDIDPNALHRHGPPVLDTLTRDDLLRLALERRPDVRAAILERDRAASSVALNKRERVPDVALVAEYMQQGTGQLAIQPPTLTFGVSLPLPVFYQQQGEIAKAESDLHTQDVQLAKAKAQVFADVETALATYRSSRRKVERMESGLLQRAARARDLVEVQYRKGSASLLELLDAQRTVLSTRMEYLRNLDEYWGSIFALEKAVGQELVK